MKIPKKFKVKAPRTREHKYYHYEYVKSYPNFIQYKCLENGTLESFQRSFFALNHAKEFFKNDNCCN